MSIRQRTRALTPVRSRLFEILVALACATVAGQARADDETPAEAPEAAKRDKVMELLEKLKEKGVISQEDFDAIAGETPEDRVRARAERRREALKRAQDAEREEKQKLQYGGRWNSGIVFETEDKSNTFKLSGRVHADYRAFLDDSAASTFDVRRAYLTLAGTWGNWLSWDVTGDFAQSGTAFDVAYFNIRWSDAAQLRLGQFKMPMSLEELTSSRFIDFQERSIVNKFVPAKERGIMLHGVPARGFTYGIGVSNGQGKNNNETAPQFDRPDVVARVTTNVAELLETDAKAIYHFGVSASTGTQAPTMTISTSTEARGATFFSTGSSFNGTGVDRTRTGFETALAYGPLKFQAEWLNTNYTGRSSAGTAYDRDIETYYVSLLWMVTGERYAEAYKNGVFGRISPYQNYTPGQGGTGALELGLRYSGFNAGDFLTTNAAGTGQLSSATSATNKADTLTLQAKWIWNPNLKFYLDYVETRFDTPIRFSTGNVTTDKERAVTFRGAFDF